MFDKLEHSAHSSAALVHRLVFLVAAEKIDVEILSTDEPLKKATDLHRIEIRLFGL